MTIGTLSSCIFVRDYASSQHAVPCVPCGGPGAGYVRPDIRGYATSGIIWKDAWRSYGALWTEDSGNSDKKSVAPGPDPIVNVRMRAGAYDSTYGGSSSVSVPAAYALMIIKA